MTLTKKFAGALLFAGILASVFAADSDIRLNSVGFLPNFPKAATIAVGEACPDCAVPFRVARSNGDVAFSGVTGPSKRNSDTGEELLVADFSALTEPGRYYLEADGIGRSPEFRIARDVFVEPYRAMMLGMYLWRCGTAVKAEYNGRTYEHAACHTNDASLKYVINTGADTKRDAANGWHDAGDYNKYVVNSGVSVGLMLKAWERFSERIEAIELIAVTPSGSIPAYLTEIKWNLDWVAKMHSTDGKVWHKISTLRFGSDIMPQNETTARYYVPWGTEATGSFVAMMAQAARIYAPYSQSFANTCLAKARLSYDLLANNGFVAADQSAFSTGTYTTDGDSDKRLWAAAEMWESTGEERFLQDVEDMLYSGDTMKTSLLTNQVQWGNVSNLGILTYLASPRPGRNTEIEDAFAQRLITIANGIVNTTNNHLYGRAFGASLYNWGANGTIAGTAYILQAAYAASGDMKYLYAVQDALSHLLGRNYYGRSFVTGVGHKPPQKPHDRTSTASGTPWPGRLIGGPHSKQNYNDAPEELKCPANLAATCWFDASADYFTNEVAINWNAAMIYALMSANNAPSDGSPVRHTPSARPAAAAKAKTTRVVRVQNGRVDIPPGAKVYALDGRLVARRGPGDAKMPELRSNGVYIIRVDNGADARGIYGEHKP